MSAKASKMYLPNSTWTWSFSLIALAQAIISLAMEAYVFAMFQTSLRGDAKATTESRTIPTYLAIFIFGFLYQLVLVYDALRLKNTIQVIGLCLYNLGMLIYSAVEYNQIEDAVNFLIGNGEINPDIWARLKPYLLAAPCIIALGTVLLSLVAWKLYDEFAWTIYKHISADLRLKRRYLMYQIYIALLKFDFFFFLGFTVQFLVVVKNTTDSEEYLTIAAIPITIILLFLAAYFTRRESKLGQIGIIIVYFAALAYFLFKLIRMYDTADPGRVADYLPARHSLTTFAVITVLLLIVTIAVSFICMRNFGKGLKPHIQRRKVQSPEDNYKTYTPYAGNDFAQQPHPMGPVSSRMTID